MTHVSPSSPPDVTAKLDAVATVRFFDATVLDARCKGFSGAVADGHGQIYFVPLCHGAFSGQITRYSLDGDFQSPTAWATYDLTRLHPRARGFVDGFLDGRYLYLVPYHHDHHHGLVARLDTTEDFRSADAWQFFDLQAQIHPECCGYISGAFDGRYVYFAPYQLDWGRHHGRLLRYDTQADFQSPVAWEHLDATVHWPGARGYHAAVVTDDRVFFVPFVRESRDYHGELLVYRRSGSFTDPDAWEHIDLRTLHPGACGFIGGTWDGRYLYLSPYYNGQERHGLVARLDTTQPLQSATSWTFFDTLSLHPDSRGFFGVITTGDFIYFIPHCKREGVYHGQVTRFDRRRNFTDPLAWSFLDTEAVHPLSKGYIGGCVVDDRLFMAPYETEPGLHTGRMACIDLRATEGWSTPVPAGAVHL
jgi:hypothetical protein